MANLNLMCNSEVATGKTVITNDSITGNMPQYGEISKFVQAKESLYNLSKWILDVPSMLKDTSQFLLDVSKRPSEVLKDVENGKLINDILDGYSDLVDEFYNLEDPSSFKGFFNKAFKYDYKENRFKDSSDYADLNDSLDTLEKQDPAKFQYFKAFMHNLETPSRTDPFLQTVRENLLKNSISSGLMNSLQITQTIIPNVQDINDLFNAVDMYIKDKNNGHKELKELGIGNKTFMDQLKAEEHKGKWLKFDVFQLPEVFNQGITYYLGKAEAKRLNTNTSEDELKKAGIKKNEDLNFIARPGNQPRAYWSDGWKNSLVLLSYTIQFNKMYFGAYKDILAGNSKKKINGVKFLASYSIINTLLFGVEAAIPFPIWAALGMTDDGEEFRKYLKSLSKFAIFPGLLNLDLAPYAQPGNIKLGSVGASVITNLNNAFGYAGKTISKMVDNPEELENPTNYKNFIKLVRAGLIVSPLGRYSKGLDKLNIGGGQLGEFLELGYRVGSKNYDRSDFTTGNKYETNAIEEAYRILGKSYSESKKGYGIEE